MDLPDRSPALGQYVTMRERFLIAGALAVAAMPAKAQPAAPTAADTAATVSPGGTLVDSFLPMPLGDRLLDALYQRMRGSVATTRAPNPPPPAKLEQAMNTMATSITAEFRRLYPAWRQSQAVALDKSYSPAELRQLTVFFADPRWPDVLVRGMQAIPLDYADDRSDPNSTGPKPFLEEISLRVGPADKIFLAELTATPAGQRFMAESKDHFDVVFKDAVDAGERKASDQFDLLRDATRGEHRQMAR